MATPSKLLIKNRFSPQETSVTILYQVSHRQWPDLFTIIPSPRKFAECLHCDVSPPPSYLFCLVPSSHLSYTVYMIVQVTFIHSCIHASTHQYFHVFTHSSVHNAHAYTQYQFIRDFISHPGSWSAASFRLCFKSLVLNNV